jgi:AcrR family transcriptional regulator
MPSEQTRTKIQEAAIRLFNRDGMANVRLQAIADEAVVSLGNLTYHYPNKVALIEAIWADIREERRILLAEFRVLPLFTDLERQMRRVFDLQQQYQFLYINTADLLRISDSIAHSWREHQTWQRTAAENMLHFNVARGVFQPELYPEQFRTLAEVYWFICDGWIGRQRNLGQSETDYVSFHHTIWSVLFPLLTPLGRQEYAQIRPSLNERTD